MAATEAQIAYLTLLKMGDGSSPETFTTIAEVKSINGFGFTASEVNATHMESPNGYEEFVAGLKTGDTMTIRLNGIRSNMLLTKAVWDAGLRKNFELNLPSTLPDYDFALIPLAWHTGDLTPSGLVEVECTGRITGAISGS